MSKYYDNWKNQNYVCKSCGWHGIGNQLAHGESFESLFELDCPTCNARIAIVEYPTLNESRDNWDKVEPIDKAVVEIAESHERTDQQNQPKSRLREIGAWVAGGLAILVTGVALGQVAHKLGLPSDIHFDKPIVRESNGEYIEIYSITTSTGYSIMLFSIVIGIWAGRAFFFSSFKAGFSPLGKLTFKAWLLAAATLIVAEGLIDLIIQSAHSSYVVAIFKILQVLSAIGISWVYHQWWKNRKDKFPAR